MLQKHSKTYNLLVKYIEILLRYVSIKLMKQRQNVNMARLLEWAAFFKGDEGPRKWLSVNAEVSMALINQMFLGRAPGVLSQIRICRALGVSQSDLFPVCEALKESA